MPSNPFHQSSRVPFRSGGRAAIGLLIMATLFAVRPAAAQTPVPMAIRSKQMELHYRLLDAEPGAQVQLWYTRDRGATWQASEFSDGTANPAIFSAPAEGLYGFTLALLVPGRVPAPPAAGSQPQRWVFVDYTPPLAQWDGVEAGDSFTRNRNLQLRWTAYDDHPLSRPIALSYQSSVDGQWQPIDSALPNTGRFDWVVPPEVGGQLSLKLTVTDQGGHVVERIYGPVAMERWMTAASAATRPAVATSTRPAEALVGPPATATRPAAVDMETRLKAQELRRQGEFHMQRGQYAQAVERFREAIEADPDQVPAISNLAYVHYLQRDYARAVEVYHQALEKEPKDVAALRGAALAYVALKQYPQSRAMLERILAVDEKDAQAWFDLGDVIYMMGESPRARSCWTRATTVDPTARLVIDKATTRLETYR